MLASTLSLGLLLGLTTATPLSLRTRSTSYYYPPTSTSKGFQLVVNLVDPSADFSTPIQNSYITSIHTGAGLALVGVSDGFGRVFYQNGTADEVSSKQATVITDGGTPVFPSGLKLQAGEGDEDGVETANLDAGYGTPGVQLSVDEPYSRLIPQTFLACNESLAYYQGQYFIILKQRAGGDGPDNCVAVNLVPQCATLEDLPEGSYSSHEFAVDSQCYDNVPALKRGE